jgi:hypothetical protein
MNTNTTTPQQTLLIQLPSSHTLHHCIGFTPAGIYCKETGIQLTISNKSIIFILGERVTNNETTNYFKGLLIFLLHVKQSYTVDLVEKLKMTHRVKRMMVSTDTHLSLKE